MARHAAEYPFAETCASISSSNDQARPVIFGEFKQNRTIILACQGFHILVQRHAVAREIARQVSDLLVDACQVRVRICNRNSDLFCLFQKWQRIMDGASGFSRVFPCNHHFRKIDALDAARQDEPDGRHRESQSLGRRYESCRPK